MAGAAKIDWSDVPAETVFEGITRQVVNGKRQTMVRYIYQPGSQFPVHSHPEEQVTLVISGAIEFEVDGKRVQLSAGQVAIIPSGVPHGARVLGNGVVETFNALSPRRRSNPFSTSGD